MQFRFRGVATGLELHRDGVTTIVFDSGEAQRVELRNGSSESSELQCEVMADVEPPRRVREAFDHLAAQRMPPGSLPPERWRKPLAQLDPSGQILIPIGPGVPMSYMPESFQQFANKLHRNLSDAANRAVGLLRWRSAEIGPQRPFTSSALSWSLDGEEWHGMPASTGLTISADTVLEVPEGTHEDIQLLWEQGQGEPFPYELLREAWGQRDDRPRSALLMAVTALEIAVKQYIANRVEPAAFLVNEMPSPNVIKLLREYLPTLEPPEGAPPTASKLEPLPDELLELLRNRRDQRNDLIHKPRSHLRPKAVATPARALSAILAVRQVLLRFDIADGRVWAKNHLSEALDEEPSAGWRPVL